MHDGKVGLVEPVRTQIVVASLPRATMIAARTVVEAPGASVSGAALSTMRLSDPEVSRQPTPATGSPGNTKRVGDPVNGSTTGVPFAFRPSM
jgi:hypothetical protein